MSDEIPFDTSKVEGIAGGRTCSNCHMTKQWRQGNWVCLNCDNAMPADWSHPMSHQGLTVKGGLDEKDKVQIVKEEKQTTTRVEVPSIPKQRVQKEIESLITIPQQAREVFQKLIWNTLDVRLRQVDAENLLALLEEMPTPQKMSDAKAIIRLIDQLDSYIKKEN